MRRRSRARARAPQVKTEDVPRVIGYLRVSSKKQDKSGLSLEAQEERIRKYVEYQEYELHSICVDRALSGRTMKRAAFQKVLRILQSGEANTLCVTKLDRVARNLNEATTLMAKYFNPRKENSWKLVSCYEQIDTTTPAGRMMINQYFLIAEWEADVASERTREALQAKRARGERMGCLDYGYTVGEDGQTLIPDEAEQEVIETIWSLASQEISQREIARRLEAMGVRSRKGKPLAQSAVARILKREDQRREEAA